MSVAPFKQMLILGILLDSFGKLRSQLGVQNIATKNWVVVIKIIASWILGRKR